MNRKIVCHTFFRNASFGVEDSSQQIWRLSAFPWRLPQLSPEELKGVREIAGEIGKGKMGEESGQGGDDSKKSPLMPLRIRHGQSRAAIER